MNRLFGFLTPVLAFAAPVFGQYAITTSGLPVASVNQAYSAAVQTNSAAVATACTVVSGALPNGLTLQTSGTGCSVSGTPPTATTAGFSMTVTNNQGQTTPSQSFLLTVFGITSVSLPAGSLNSPYTFQFQANGGGPYQWSVTSGSLPPGLTLSPSGSLSGTPQSTGQFSFTLRVADTGLGLTNSRSFSLSVSGAQTQQFQIVAAALPDAVANQPYSASIQTTGAQGNLAFPNGCLVVQGNLPSGITISPSGTSCLLSGGTSSLGTYPFQVQATDSQGQVTPPVGFTLTVGSSGSSGLIINTSSIPNGSTATPFLPGGTQFTFTATGGTGIYTWVLDSGTLPSGLSLATHGALTGTPTQSGTFNFTIRVVSSGILTSFQQTTTKSFSMTILSGGLTIVETSIPPITAGQPYSFPLHASGGTSPYHWAFGNTTLTGLTIDANTGVISGKVFTTGTLSLPVIVNDSAGAQVTLAFSLVASFPFSIQTASLPDGFLGNGYSQSLQVAGGQSPFTWSIASGTVPQGLTFTTSGSFSGVPSAGGQFVFTVSVMDAVGRKATKIFILLIGSAGPVQIINGSLSDGSTGSPYMQTFNASGGQTPYSWSVVAGALPSGLSLTTATGVLQGTPTQGGTFSFAIQAADAAGNTTAKIFSLFINSLGLTLSPNQLSFTYVAGGSQPATQSVNLTSNTSESFTVTTSAPWLSASPSSGATPAVLTVTVNPSGLAAGAFNGTVTVTPVGVTEPSHAIAVTLTVSGTSGLTVGPSTLVFTYQTGGQPPESQTLSVTTGGSPVNFTAAVSSGNWLSVSPASGSTPGTLTVSVNPSGLSSGVYSGTITILAVGPSLQVPVTLTVSGPAAASVTLSKSSLSFAYALSDALPPTQSVALASVPRVSFTASSGADPWLSVTPTVGSTPANLLISVNPTGLAPALYNGVITIVTTELVGNRTFTIPITFTVSAVGFPVITAVVNAASYAKGAIAPGEIVTLGGSMLGPATPASLALDATGKVATTLGGTQVLFNGFPAPLTYASASQVNAVVPYEVAGQINVLVTAKFQGLTSIGFPVNLVSSAPGLFTLNASGTGPGAILNQDGSVNSPLHPASRGDTVVLYSTGEGQTAPAGVTGKVTAVSPTPPLTPQPILQVRVTIGGQPAVVSFFGEAPGIVSGVMQINVQIPANASPGDLPVEVSVGTNRSQGGVTVSVQ